MSNVIVAEKLPELLFVDSSQGCLFEVQYLYRRTVTAGRGCMDGSQFLPGET